MNEQLHAVQTQQSLNELSATLKRNEHTLIVMSAEEFIDFFIIQKQRQGLAHNQIVHWIDGIMHNSQEISRESKEKWYRNKDNIKDKGAFFTRNV